MVLLAVRFMLAITFAVAGVAKLLDLPGSRKSLQGFGVPGFLARPLAFLLPAAELACAAALIPGASARWGAIGVAVLLILFIAGISVNLARGRKPDCHCFGQLSSEPVGMKTLVRNAILLALAGFVVWKDGENPAAISFESYPGSQIALIAAILVVAAGLVLALWLLFQMLQQNGRLLVRLDTIEKKLGIDPDATPERGLPVGAPAPQYGLAAAEVTVKRLLLVFTEPDCGPCEALQPELAQWRREYSDRLAIVSITASDTSQAYQVTGTPTAVLVVNGFIASPLAEGTEAIRDLVHQATKPPAVKKGESVPALQLPDLDGATVNLTSLRGFRTLVLFWSPSCGYCQDILDEVKRWERLRPEGAPQLLIISSGTAEEIREQGFSSTVLVDQDGAASKLGAEGTPSALLIDANGIVASKIHIGASQVFALAQGNV